MVIDRLAGKGMHINKKKVQMNEEDRNWNYFMLCLIFRAQPRYISYIS